MSSSPSNSQIDIRAPKKQFPQQTYSQNHHPYQHTQQHHQQHPQSEPKYEDGRQEIIVHGWLRKKSHNGVLGFHYWQNRYFELYKLPKGQLWYYQSDEASKPSKTISVKDISSVIKLEGKHGLRFDISLRSGKVYQLKALHAEDVKKWINGIRDIKSLLGNVEKRGGDYSDSESRSTSQRPSRATPPSVRSRPSVSRNSTPSTRPDPNRKSVTQPHRPSRSVPLSQAIPAPIPHSPAPTPNHSTTSPASHPSSTVRRNKVSGCKKFYRRIKAPLAILFALSLAAFIAYWLAERQGKLGGTSLGDLVNQTLPQVNTTPSISIDVNWLKDSINNLTEAVNKTLEVPRQEVEKRVSILRELDLWLEDIIVETFRPFHNFFKRVLLLIPILFLVYRKVFWRGENYRKEYNDIRPSTRVSFTKRYFDEHFGSSSSRHQVDLEKGENPESNTDLKSPQPINSSNRQFSQPQPSTPSGHRPSTSSLRTSQSNKQFLTKYTKRGSELDSKNSNSSIESVSPKKGLLRFLRLPWFRRKSTNNRQKQQQQQRDQKLRNGGGDDSSRGQSNLYERYRSGSTTNNSSGGQRMSSPRASIPSSISFSTPSVSTNSNSSIQSTSARGNGTGEKKLDIRISGGSSRGQMQQHPQDNSPIQSWIGESPSISISRPDPTTTSQPLLSNKNETSLPGFIDTRSSDDPRIDTPVPEREYHSENSHQFDYLVPPSSSYDKRNKKRDLRMKGGNNNSTTGKLVKDTIPISKRLKGVLRPNTVTPSDAQDAELIEDGEGLVAIPGGFGGNEDSQSRNTQSSDDSNSQKNNQKKVQQTTKRRISSSNPDGKLQTIPGSPPVSTFKGIKASLSPAKPKPPTMARASPSRSQGYVRLGNSTASPDSEPISPPKAELFHTRSHPIIPTPKKTGSGGSSGGSSDDRNHINNGSNTPPTKYGFTTMNNTPSESDLGDHESEHEGNLVTFHASDMNTKRFTTGGSV